MVELRKFYVKGEWAYCKIKAREKNFGDAILRQLIFFITRRKFIQSKMKFKQDLPAMEGIVSIPQFIAIVLLSQFAVKRFFNRQLRS